MVIPENLPLWAKILIGTPKNTEDRTALDPKESQRSDLSDLTHLPSGHAFSATSLKAVHEKRHRRRWCFVGLGEAN